MGKYELLYIVHPDLESSIDKITGNVKGYIEARKGKITYEENWGKRKLAYEIKKSDVGIYVLVYFEAPASGLAKIERDIRLTEEIIRFMVLSAPEKIKASIPKREKKEITETIKEKEEAKPAEKKAATKTIKKEPQKTESEAERMKKLDEKLGALLGDKEDNKSKSGQKTAKEKK